MPFTYEDYLNAANPQRRQDAYEGLLSQDQWAALTDSQRVAQAGGLSINPGDSRYADLARQTGAEPGRSITFSPGAANMDPRGWNDPSRVFSQDGYFYHAANNVSPWEQDRSDSSGLGDGTRWGILGPAFVLGGGLLANALGAGAAAGAGADAATGAAATGATDFVGPSAANMFDFSTIPSVQASQVGGMAATPAGLGGSSSVLGSLFSGDFAGAGSQALNWAMNNPLQAYGAAQTVGGLFQGNGGSRPASGGSGSKQGGGTGDPTKLARPQFTPNPYLLQQLRQGGYIS